MKIILDDKTFVLSPELENELIGKFYNEAISKYKEIDAQIRLGLQIYARKKIYDLEKKSGRADLRPGRGEDPVLHLAGIIMSGVKEGLNGVTLDIKTSDGHTISACAWQFISENSTGG